MNLSSPFIKRPVMTTLVMLAICLAGFLAFRFLPVSDLPNIENPRIQVMAEYPSASPEVVLREITIPIEKALHEVKGIKELSSTSSQGMSMISLTFDLNKNMDETIRDLQAALTHVEGSLPKNLPSKPSYFRETRSSMPIMSFALTSSTHSVGDLRNFAESYVVPRLNRLEGVAQVGIFGSERSLWIRVNPELLAARKIGYNQIIDTFTQQTQNLALGKITTSGKSLSIELESAPFTIREIENFYIAKSNVRLKEVASVSNQSSQEMVCHYVTPTSWTNALIVDIKKATDANTVSVANAAKELLSSLQKELPASIQMIVAFDKSVWINQSILDVQWSLFFAFILVIGVIYFSLGRLADALIPTLALPLSIIGTFIVMYLFDFSLDLLSLLALTLSVGFVVDDAIVVLENIIRHQEMGKSRLEASFAGSKQISFTILSMTLSLVAVFIPLLFMPGINGLLFREFSCTLAAAIIVSGFISLSLTPMLCSRLLSEQRKVTHDNAQILGWYERSLACCLRYPKSVLSAALVLALSAYPLFSGLSVQLFPPEDRGFLMTFVNLPSGLSQDEFNAYQKKLGTILQKKPFIQSFIDFGWNGNLGFFISLKERNARPEQAQIVAEIQQAFDKEPGIRSFTQPYQLLTVDFEFGMVGQYKYRLRGQRLEEVIAVSEMVQKQLKRDPTFGFVQSSVRDDDPKLVVKIDEKKAHAFGFTKQQVQELISQAYSLPVVAEIHNGTDKEKIILDLHPDWGKRLNSLSKLTLKNDDNVLVGLAALSRWEEKRGLTDYSRCDLLPAVELYFSVNNQASLGAAVKRFEETVQPLLPKTVTGGLAGSAKELANATSDTVLLLLAASLVMYIVLGILYESFVHPLTILSSLPFAGLGGILTLYLFNESLSIFSAVGFLLLLGIVKKNGIMMIDYALEAKSQGKSSFDAILEGSLARFRPIMMTTVAAIMGALPIAIGIGEGSEMYRGLGLVIVGGLCFSQVLTLYVTPCLFILLDKKPKEATVAAS